MRWRYSDSRAEREANWPDKDERDNRKNDRRDSNTPVYAERVEKGNSQDEGGRRREVPDSRPE